MGRESVRRPRGAPRDRVPRGGTPPDPAFFDIDPVDSPANALTSGEHPATASDGEPRAEPTLLIRSGVVSIETDGGVQTVRVIDKTGQERRYPLSLEGAPDELFEELTAHYDATVLRIKKLESLEADTRSQLAELKMHKLIKAAVTANVHAADQARAAQRMAAAEAARRAREEAALKAREEAELDAREEPTDKTNVVRVENYKVEVQTEGDDTVINVTGPDGAEQVYALDLQGAPLDLITAIQKARLDLYNRRLQAFAGTMDLSPAEQRQLELLNKIEAAYNTRVKAEDEARWRAKLAAEAEARIAKATAGKPGQKQEREKPVLSLEARLRNVFHRPIPPDVLKMAQKPGGFLIKARSGDMFAVQIAAAESGKKNVWQVFVVSQSGKGSINIDHTFEVKGNRMLGMTAEIGQGLERYVSVVGANSLSPELQAFYQAHMRIRQQRGHRVGMARP